MLLDSNTVWSHSIHPRTKMLPELNRSKSLLCFGLWVKEELRLVLYELCTARIKLFGEPSAASLCPCSITASQVGSPGPDQLQPQQPTQRRGMDLKLQTPASRRIQAFSSPFYVPLKTAENRKHISAQKKLYQSSKWKATSHLYSGRLGSGQLSSSCL